MKNKFNFNFENPLIKPEAYEDADLQLIDSKDEIERLLRLCTPLQQKCIRLFFIEEMDLKTICILLGGRSKDATAKVIARGLETMQEHLDLFGRKKTK